MKSEDKKKGKEKKSKGGRPRKDRTGLPQVDIVSAINYTKKAYESIKTTLKSFSGMNTAMGMDKNFGRRALAEIREYGLVEQEGGGWKISDLGRRVSEGDVNAVIQIVQKSDIIGDLYNNLKDKEVDRDYIEDFIKKKRYKYNIQVPAVADKFIEIMNYIKGLEGGYVTKKKEGGEIDRHDITKWIKIVKLRYALKPPKEKFSELAVEVANELENIDDPTIKAIAEQIKESKDNKEYLSKLVNLLIRILTNLKPIQILESIKETENDKKEQKIAEEDSEENQKN